MNSIVQKIKSIVVLISLLFLTGGIGAGKSYVCSLLREKGVEIYDTDNAAKRLIAQSPEIRQQLIKIDRSVPHPVVQTGILPLSLYGL